jgi:hypothetical protein
MTLRPAAFSARALSVTAMVADGFTRSSAADRKGIIVSLRVLSKGKIHQKTRVVNWVQPRSLFDGIGAP